MAKTITFKVSYLGHCGRGNRKKVVRRIELKETQNLDDLHEAIIYQSFKWDDPHLYSFYMDKMPHSRDRATEYTCEEHINMDFNGPNSSCTKLKELNLVKDQKFLFVFDFGDGHHFEILVEDFGESKKGAIYPVVFEEIGVAPEQYVG